MSRTLPPVPSWDWDRAAREAGVSQDGTFNAAAMPMPASAALIGGGPMARSRPTRSPAPGARP